MRTGSLKGTQAAPIILCNAGFVNTLNQVITETFRRFATSYWRHEENAMADTSRREFLNQLGVLIGAGGVVLAGGATLVWPD